MLRTNLPDVAHLAILFWQGTITSKEEIDALRQEVTTRLTKGDVVLDFSEVESLGPEALAMLAALWRIADRQATRLRIFNPSLASYLALRRLRALRRIPILTDGEFLGLLREAKALNARPSERAARHWGQRLSHALPHVLEERLCAWPGWD